MAFLPGLHDCTVLFSINLIIKNDSAHIYTFLIWGFLWDSALWGIDKLISKLELSSPNYFIV